MKIKEFSRIENKEIHSEIELSDWNEAKKKCERIFNEHNSSWAFEETEYANGNRSLSVKDSGNKIIYQLKIEKQQSCNENYH